MQKPWSVIDDEELRLLRSLEYQVNHMMIGPQPKELNAIVENLRRYRERRK